MEYKSTIVTSPIPKVVSSFANTVGGVWIIGVQTDVNNRPIFPIRGFPRERGVEERITQACYQGPYPPLPPEIRIIDVPGVPENVVVVVQVPESVEAPHAIENTTKVYIRTNSTTEIIQLAEIERIEYLLKRRQQPEQKREEMIAGMATRNRVSAPYLRVIVSPRYPWRPIFHEDVLKDRLQTFSQPDTYYNLSGIIRLVRNGFMSMVLARSAYGPDYHFEINLYGVVSCYVPLALENEAVRLDRIVREVGRALNSARYLLKGTGINILVRVHLQEVRNSLIVIGGSQGELRSIEEVVEAEVFLALEELDNDLLF
ncbi:ATP-binding protein, partial [Nitrospiraceae bacterium AH_259_D15_M11_P09]|nr:ATP-binding protein [Nitrospiraceae bacterium AH_259_D15_M11_P09]